MINGEWNDFFVCRRKRQTNKGEESRNVVSAVVNGIEISHQEIDYMPSSGNVSRIRIPSLLYIIHRMKSDEYHVFKSCIRKQVGSHLFATNRGFVSYLKTYLDENFEYHVSSTYRIHSVYPCFVATDSGHQMCIGLRYTLNTSKGFRTFGRTKDSQSPSGGVFDLMEEFLNPNRIKMGIESKVNRELFPKGGLHFAIYVCCGAKLIVEDNRMDKSSEAVAPYYNRSLFQSGSLVVFSCDLNFELPFGINNETLDKKGIKKVSYEWRDAALKGVLKPDSSLYQDWFKSRGLDHTKEQVIFLGHNYSQNNSVCWRLRIEMPTPDGHSTAALTAPDGGRIVDVQSWDWGWAEIYWRHRYERLYDKVLVPSEPTKYLQKSYFGFHVPRVSGPNPYYWPKKILGVGVNFNSWRITFSYLYKDQKTLALPSFYEKFIECSDLSSVPPFPPPLYPPIYSNSELLYLPYKTFPKFLSATLVDIGGDIYKLVVKEGEEYLWSDPKRVALHPNNKLSADQRLGLDLMVYSKENVVIGRKRFVYFEITSESVLNQSQQTDSHEKSSEVNVKDDNDFNDIVAKEQQLTQSKTEQVIEQMSPKSGQLVSDQNVPKILI